MRPRGGFLGRLAAALDTAAGFYRAFLIIQDAPSSYLRILTPAPAAEVPKSYFLAGVFRQGLETKNHPPGGLRQGAHPAGGVRIEKKSIT